MLCYWQYNKATDAKKYAAKVRSSDKNLFINSKILKNMQSLSAFPHHSLTRMSKLFRRCSVALYTLITNFCALIIIYS